MSAEYTCNLGRLVGHPRQKNGKNIFRQDTGGNSKWFSSPFSASSRFNSHALFEFEFDSSRVESPITKANGAWKLELWPDTCSRSCTSVYGRTGEGRRGREWKRDSIAKEANYFLHSLPIPSQLYHLKKNWCRSQLRGAKIFRFHCHNERACAVFIIAQVQLTKSK